MNTPRGDILGADETLKALFERFRADPESRVFEELSEALLARGHANEALQIAEFGLQKMPEHIGGRVQRAAALLALGRPRVAYVELMRARAIEQFNQKALRLLGKVFVEAGLPARAAKLLAERHRAAANAKKAARAEKPVRATPGPDFDETRKIDLKSMEATTGRGASAPPQAPPASGSQDVAGMFAELTKDLGLKAEKPISTKVEVTQIIRMKRPPMPREQLSSIDGPIVDKTQPGELSYSSNVEELEIISTKTPGQLFDLMGTRDDEPLFNEDMPFSVQGVGDGPAANLDGEHSESETVNDDLPAELDFEQLRTAMEREMADPSPDSEAGVMSGKAPSSRPPSPSPATGPGGEVSPEMLEKGPKPEVGVMGSRTDLPYLRRFEAREHHQSSDASVDSVVSEQRGPALELAKPPGRGRRAALALIGTAALVTYALGLAWLSRAQLAIWFSG